MRTGSTAGIAGLLLAVTTLASGEARGAGKLADLPGLKDPPLFTRMPGFFLPHSNSFVEKDFDGQDFTVTEGKKTVRKRVEGRFTEHWYTFDTSTGKQPSPVQIIRNYQNAAAQIGGKVLHEGGSETTLLVVRDGRETWVQVQPVNGGRNYHLRIVELQAMQQAVTADARALGAGLASSGHVEVPGILFDTGKADVKPESEPALAEVAKLLRAGAGLRVWVVGHTDWVGPAEANLALSSARAQAVVRVLVQKHGIDGSRLAPFGAGPYAPVASNGDEEGRARNRRVELVAQQ